MKRSLALPIFALVLGLGGCAGVRWQKPGADDSALAQDLTACRKLAQEKFGGAAGIVMPSSPDPRFGPMGPSQADLRMQESQAAGMCMRGKGYALVPAEN